MSTQDETEPTAPEPTPPEPTTPEPTNWHLLLGMLLKALLSIVGIIVQIEVPLSHKPLRLDILLLRRAGRLWTEEQRERLPDGIRQRQEPYILCEFKYTESINMRALVQALNYEVIYRTENKLKEHEITTFVVSAHTPNARFLAEYGYRKSAIAGIYRTETAGWQRVGLMVLNELENQPYNAFFKCFASRKKARQAAFTLLEQIDSSFGPSLIWEIITGLRSLFAKQEDVMNEISVTPEYVQSLGAGIRRMILNHATYNDLSEEVRKDVIASAAPQERLEGLAAKDRVEGLAPKERLEGLAPEVVVAQFNPKELLSFINPTEIERYLRQQATVVQVQKTEPKSRKPRKRTEKANS